MSISLVPILYALITSRNVSPNVLFEGFLDDLDKRRDGIGIIIPNRMIF